MKTTKAKTITIRLTDHELKLIDKQAQKHETTRSNFLRTNFIYLIRQYETNN